MGGSLGILSCPLPDRALPGIRQLYGEKPAVPFKTPCPVNSHTRDGGRGAPRFAPQYFDCRNLSGGRMCQERTRSTFRFAWPWLSTTSDAPFRTNTRFSAARLARAQGRRGHRPAGSQDGRGERGDLKLKRRSRAAPQKMEALPCIASNITGLLRCPLAGG